MRVHAVQVWPPLMKQLASPTLTALARSASSSTTKALLPPSSSDDLLDRVGGRPPCTRLPAAVEPVKDTMSTSGWAAIASPTTGPSPVTRLKTPGGRPTSLEDLGQREGRQRRDLRRLEHDGAAGGERRGDLGDDLVQRVVPRRDRADDADRLLDDEGVGDLLLEGVAREQLGVGPQHPHRVADLHRLAERQRRAHLGGDEQRHLVGARLERVGGRRQQRRAVGRRARGPAPRRRPGPRRPPRRRPRRCPRARRDLLLGRRVDDRQPLAAVGRRPTSHRRRRRSASARSGWSQVVVRGRHARHSDLSRTRGPRYGCA